MIKKDFISVSYTINPAVGSRMACRCKVVILGISIPLSKLLISKIAFESGADPSVFMATFC
ncbi:MAG: hypothetical protein IPG79_07525 [Saprospiraceae bacterium]|nr:hypothetical protein [Saprospiraceae bacterium]